jgi:hypothetical protein
MSTSTFTSCGPRTFVLTQPHRLVYFSVNGWRSPHDRLTSVSTTWLFYPARECAGISAIFRLDRQNYHETSLPSLPDSDPSAHSQPRLTRGAAQQTSCGICAVHQSTRVLVRRTGMPGVDEQEQHSPKLSKGESVVKKIERWRWMSPLKKKGRSGVARDFWDRYDKRRNRCCQSLPD